MRRLLLAATLLPCLAFAGRPLTTEDASTLDDKACQLESWVDRSRAGDSLFAFVPACGYAGVEWQLGAIRTRPDGGGGRTAATFFQGKHAIRSVDDGDWGIGVVAGLTRVLDREEKNGWGDPYLLVPFSFGVGADKETRALVHLNVGASRNRAEGRNLTLWGVAVEKPVTSRLTLLAESFGENSRDPFFRVGGRFTAFDKLDVDLTWVTRPGGAREDRYWSLGIHWETDPFLP